MFSDNPPTTISNGLTAKEKVKGFENIVSNHFISLLGKKDGQKDDLCFLYLWR